MQEQNQTTTGGMPPVSQLLVKVSRLTQKVSSQAQIIEDLVVKNEASERECTDLREQVERLQMLLKQAAAKEKENERRLITVEQKSGPCDCQRIGNLERRTVATCEAKYQKLVEKFEKKEVEWKSMKAQLEQYKRTRRKNNTELWHKELLQERLEEAEKYVMMLENETSSDKLSEGIVNELQAIRKQHLEQSKVTSEMQAKLNYLNVRIEHYETLVINIADRLGCKNTAVSDSIILQSIQIVKDRERSLQNVVNRFKILIDRALNEKEQLERAFCGESVTSKEIMRELEEQNLCKEFPNIAAFLWRIQNYSVHHLQEGIDEKLELEECLQGAISIINECSDLLKIPASQRTQVSSMRNALGILSQLVMTCFVQSIECNA